MMPRWMTLALLTAALTADAAEPLVVNAGRGGHNSRNLLARLARDVLAHKPTLVVMMVGTNDVLNHGNAVPLPEFRTNIEKLVARINAAKSRVLLMTIPPCHVPYLLLRHPASFYEPDGPAGRIRKANAIVREVAKRTHAPVVDVFTLFDQRGSVGESKECWLRNEANSGSKDGVHPTAEGYRAIAAAVAAAIRKHRLPHDRVVCLGDSITYGAGVTGAGTATGATYPARLLELLEKAPQGIRERSATE